LSISRAMYFCLKLGPRHVPQAYGFTFFTLPPIVSHNMSSGLYLTFTSNCQYRIIRPTCFHVAHQRNIHFETTPVQ
jgi:hypothetical protein